MTALAILATLAAIVWSVIVLFANMMADSPKGFQGGSTIVAAWLATAVLWLAWWFG